MDGLDRNLRSALADASLDAQTMPHTAMIQITRMLESILSLNYVGGEQDALRRSTDMPTIMLSQVRKEAGEVYNETRCCTYRYRCIEASNSHGSDGKPFLKPEKDAARTGIDSHTV